MYNSVIWRTFTLSCNHHQHPSPEIFHQMETLCPLNNDSPSSPPGQLLGTTVLLSVSESRLSGTTGISLQAPHINETIRCLSFVSGLFPAAVSSRFMHPVTRWNSFPFNAEWYSTAWIDHTLFIYSFVDGRVGCFPPFGYWEWCCCNGWQRGSSFSKHKSVSATLHSLQALQSFMLRIKSKLLLSVHYFL